LIFFNWVKLKDILAFILNTTSLFKNPSFSEKKLKNKSPSAKAKGLEIDELPLLESFRTFKGNMSIDNIKLNQLILQY